MRRFLAGLTDLERLPSWYVDLMVDDALRLPAPIWLATLDGLAASTPPTDVGVITAPVLVVSGGRDHLLGHEQTAALVVGRARRRVDRVPGRRSPGAGGGPGPLAGDVRGVRAQRSPTTRDR